ncbi:hypothetical protein B484DRAFT_425961 [Ochromonadaceae sp. CCMP2298]|nr:hypothetical protein B484DRAFT_425961 [Ochromonadaceae sp. CCMP2298]
MSAMSMPVNSFYSSIEESLAFFEGAARPPKQCSYASLVYMPPTPLVDFGKEVWPSPHKKKDVCPRLLLISNWTDNRFSLIGGNHEAGEDSLAALSREFLEEMGTEVAFTQEDYQVHL